MSDIIQMGKQRLVFKTYENKEWEYASIDTATVISLEELEDGQFWMVKKDFFLDKEEEEETHIFTALVSVQSNKYHDIIGAQIAAGIIKQLDSPPKHIASPDKVKVAVYKQK